jgi:hypothetical protein
MTRARTYAVSSLGRGFTPVRRPVPGTRGEPVYGPTCATREEAEEWIFKYERLNGCEPGCDHGFGMGSGFLVEERP